MQISPKKFGDIKKMLYLCSVKKEKGYKVWNPWQGLTNRIRDRPKGE